MWVGNMNRWSSRTHRQRGSVEKTAACSPRRAGADEGGGSQSEGGSGSAREHRRSAAEWKQQVGQIHGNSASSSRNERDRGWRIRRRRAAFLTDVLTLNVKTRPRIKSGALSFPPTPSRRTIATRERRLKGCESRESEETCQQISRFEMRSDFHGEEADGGNSFMFPCEKKNYNNNSDDDDDNTQSDWKVEA